MLTKATAGRNTRSSSDKDRVLWFAGRSEFAIMSLQDNKIQELKNFLPTDSSPALQPLPIKGIIAEQARLIVVLFEAGGQQCFAYLNPRLSEPNHCLAKDLLFSCRVTLLTDQSRPYMPSSGEVNWILLERLL